jgi:heme/copper-type cytochrome/quinol oxidase subunit 4
VSPDPSNWVSRVTGWCFSILAAAIALWCAVKVLVGIWPTLAMIAGIIAIIALIIRIVVYFTSRNSW